MNELGTWRKTFAKIFCVLADVLRARNGFWAALRRRSAILAAKALR